MEEGYYAPHDIPHVDSQLDHVPSAEEIPTPERLLEKEVESVPASADPPPEEKPVEQETVTQRDQVTQPAKRGKRLSVSLRLDDTDEPATDSRAP